MRSDVQTVGPAVSQWNGGVEVECDPVALEQRVGRVPDLLASRVISADEQRPPSLDKRVHGAVGRTGQCRAQVERHQRTCPGQIGVDELVDHAHAVPSATQVVREQPKHAAVHQAVRPEDRYVRPRRGREAVVDEDVLVGSRGRRLRSHQHREDGQDRRQRHGDSQAATDREPGLLAHPQVRTVEKDRQQEHDEQAQTHVVVVKEGSQKGARGHGASAEEPRPERHICDLDHDHADTDCGGLHELAPRAHGESRERDCVEDEEHGQGHSGVGRTELDVTARDATGHGRDEGRIPAHDVVGPGRHVHEEEEPCKGHEAEACRRKPGVRLTPLHPEDVHGEEQQSERENQGRSRVEE